MEYYSMILH